MTLAHLSDTHLGYRAYSRTTAQGFNQREVDVMQTFKACLTGILERDPDLVVHAGDLFHVVRPSNATIVEAYKTVKAFQEKRGGKPFVLIGGNHDSPRTSDSGNILKLFEGIDGVHVVMTAGATLDLSELDCEVLCVPSNSVIGSEKIDYTPHLGRKYSVLTLHGMVGSLIKDKGDLEIEDTNADSWTYVAMGDYHVHQTYGTNVAYCGSTDFTSTNIWEESSTPKGWIWFDTEIGISEHVPLNPRPVLDLRPINAEGLSADEIGQKMLKRAEWRDEPQPIVRQLVFNVHPEVRPRISFNLLRELNKRALSYRLVLRAPAREASNGETANAVKTIEQSWEEHVADSAPPAGVTRADMAGLGLQLLKEVAESETATPEA